MKCMFFLVILIFFHLPSLGDGATLTIAAASNLQPVFQSLAAAFQQESGVEVRASFGSSGKFFSQIAQGAPFHLFLSADSHYPHKLQEAGLTLGAPRVYALGAVVLWSTGQRDLTHWPQVLGSHDIRHIAMANPDTAPYGREAMVILQRAGLHDTVAHKLVFGESVAQANQFITTGAAEVGFTAKSVVMDPTTQGQGTWMEMPQESYNPIPQAAVVLRYAATHQPEATQRFFNFLFSPTAGTILSRYGYRLP